MAILENHFYHRTITKYTGVFGSVFNDIKILRQDGKLIKVPIAYQVKQKYDVRNTQNPDPNEVRIKQQLPRLSYKIRAITKDTTRITSKMKQLVQSGVDRETAAGINTQYNRVPYTFSFELAIKTKTLDDMLQIVEQILPYFNPSLAVIVEDNEDLDQDSAIYIKLMDAGLEDMFDSSFEGEQSLEATMNFDLEGYLYTATSASKVIKQIDINYFDITTGALIDTSHIE